METCENHADEVIGKAVCYLILCIPCYLRPNKEARGFSFPGSDQDMPAGGTPMSPQEEMNVGEQAQDPFLLCGLKAPERLFMQGGGKG